MHGGAKKSTEKIAKEVRCLVGEYAVEGVKTMLIPSGNCHLGLGSRYM